VVGVVLGPNGAGVGGVIVGMPDRLGTVELGGITVGGSGPGPSGSTTVVGESGPGPSGSTTVVGAPGSVDVGVVESVVVSLGVVVVVVVVVVVRRVVVGGAVRTEVRGTQV